NMSYFVAPDTGARYAIFGEGGGDRVAEEFGVPLLTRIPLEMETRKGGDAGVPIVVGQPASAQAAAFLALANGVIERLDAVSALRPPPPHAPPPAAHPAVAKGARPLFPAPAPALFPAPAPAAAHLRGSLSRHGHGLSRARQAHGGGRPQPRLRIVLRGQAR